MRIIFFCRSFENISGGVERASTVLMNELIARGHSVALVTWDKKNASSFFPLSPQVVWYRVDLGNPEKKATIILKIKRLFSVRRIIYDFKPDVGIGFQLGSFLAGKVYSLGMGIPFICAERNAISRLDHTRGGRFRFMTFLPMLLSKRITVQFSSYINDYPSYLHGRMCAIENPVNTVKNVRLIESGQNRKVLLSVARLSYQKNIPALIRAFEMIADKMPDWVLRIVGDGEDREDIEKMICTSLYQERIVLAAAHKDIHTEYCSADMFVLASRWEGFPNAMAEALAHGLPCIGYKNCAGVSDLLGHGKWGLLAEGNGDSESLGRTLLNLMSDQVQRNIYALRALKRSKQFDPKRIFDMWENLFRDCVGS